MCQGLGHWSYTMTLRFATCIAQANLGHVPRERFEVSPGTRR